MLIPQQCDARRMSDNEIKKVIRAIVREADSAQQACKRLWEVFPNVHTLWVKEEGPHIKVFLKVSETSPHEDMLCGSA